MAVTCGIFLFYQQIFPKLYASGSGTVPSLIEEDKKIFADYAGSESCRDCHQADYDLWAKSHHGLAERPLRPELDRAAFDPSRSFKHASQTTTARFQEGEYLIVTLGFNTNVEPFQVDRVIGADPVRQFLTASSGGRWQVHEVSYDPRANDWFDVYGTEDRQPGEYGHWTGRGMNWNSMCAGCHNTRLRKNYDEATDSYHTAMAEMTVGCEACHGPMKAHVDWRNTHPKTQLKDPTVTAISPSRMLATCGSCHSRREDLTGDFKPGDPFFDHFSPEILDEVGRWYPDGQIKDEDYELTSFLSSKMYERGVACVDCHNPHSAKPLLPGNDLCMRCHNGAFTNAPVIIPANHVHHKLTDKGGECIGCHMPVTVYMQRQPRHDHGFTIPDPLLTKQLDIPNACNRCHTDQSVGWALDYTKQWYGDKMERHTRERAEWIASAQHGEDAARDKLIGMLAENMESPYWRAVAANLLFRWGNDHGVESALLARLKDESPLVREQAARSLEPLVQSGDTAVIVALEPLLKDPVHNVRVACAWVLRATVDTQAGAGAELQAALALHSDQPKGQFQRALFLLARQQPTAALDHLQKAVVWDPFSPPLRYETAEVLGQLGRFEDAADELEAACRLQPKSGELRLELGLARAQARQFDKAVQSLEEAVKIDPQLTAAWFNLGLARDSLGRTDEALEALNHAESLAPADPQIPFARARILAAHWPQNAEAQTAANRASGDSGLDFKPALDLLERFPQNQK